MRILVTGGTGYIGSHTCVQLIEKGHEVVIIDNLSNSQVTVLESIKEITGTKPTFYQADITDYNQTSKVFEKEKLDSVIHFAALKAVGESTEKPALYYKNNIGGLVNLLHVMSEHSVKNIIFSSSATVYGDPDKNPIPETASLRTINPYGLTKLVGENILTDLANSDGSWKVVILRYFNPVGAHESGLIGESPNGKPNNIMPYICEVASGKQDVLTIFGDDYNTPDGTGIRDYIHITDLAEGHIKALEAQNGLSIYNLGTGMGYSVKDLVETFEKVNGVKIKTVIGPRRSGDSAEVYADPQKILKELNWKATKSIEDMCQDAWRWQKNQS